MGTPAARDTDSTGHAGNLTSGSADVQINGLGAIRLGDRHTCPIIHPVPHGGGAVRIGAGAALTVFVNRRPAATIGTGAPCTEGPIPFTANAVAAGSGNVFYTPANTIAGLAVTDDEDGNLRVGNNIIIEGDPDYQAKVLADLAKMGTTSIGQHRLRRLDTSGHTVKIANYTDDNTAYKVPGQNAFARPGSPNDAQHPKNGGTGMGTDVVISYSPDDWPPAPGAPATTTGAPGDVVLFHELTHADHQTHGSADGTKRKDVYDTEEEFKSIEPDENAYRRQRGFPERHSHKFV